MTARPLPTSAPSYYYAAGRRVPLEVDPEYVAIDKGRVPTRVGRDLLESMTPLVRLLPGNVALVPRSLVPSNIDLTLATTGAIYPVYVSEGARIVAYPEVRVQVAPGGKPDVLSAVQASSIPADVSDEKDGYIVLRPKSGSGIDALSLANFVHERAHPPLAQVRFIRVVPKPKTRVR